MGAVSIPPAPYVLPEEVLPVFPPPPGLHAAWRASPQVTVGVDGGGSLVLLASGRPQGGRQVLCDLPYMPALNVAVRAARLYSATVTCYRPGPHYRDGPAGNLELRNAAFTALIAAGVLSCDAARATAERAVSLLIQSYDALARTGEAAAAEGPDNGVFSTMTVLARAAPGWYAEPEL
jgi:hypothetical protein